MNSGALIIFFISVITILWEFNFSPFSLPQAKAEPEGERDIAKIALILAQDVYEGIDVDNYLARLDALARQFKNVLAPQKGYQEIIKLVNGYLFTQEGMRFADDDWEGMQIIFTLTG